MSNKNIIELKLRKKSNLDYLGNTIKMLSFIF